MHSRKYAVFWVTLVSFTVIFLAQVFIWQSGFVLDKGWWAKQGQYVLEGDNQRFNSAKAYGHPGGPIILGMISAHQLFSAPFNSTTLPYVVAFLNALAGSMVAVLCFVLRQNWWWLATTFVLATHRLGFKATPTSSLASFLVVLLSLLTFYLIENRSKVGLKLVLAWSIVSGALVATRFDIGGFMSLVFFGILVRYIGFKKALLAGLGAVYVFVLLNPFMWSVPLIHLGDLFGKIFFHYSGEIAKTLTFYNLLEFSLVSFLSIILFVYFASREKNKLPIPGVLGWVLVVVTVLLYIVFLSANYKAPRYFMPLVLMWETFLPLFLLAIDTQKWKSAFTPKVALVVLTLTYIIVMFAYPLD